MLIKKVIQGIRSTKGPNTDSDNFLQKVTIKQKLLRIYRKKALKLKKWNKTNLENQIKH